MSGYSSAVSQQVGVNRLLSGPETDDDLITVTRFPWIVITRNDFFEPFNQRNPMGPQHDFVMEVLIAMMNSHGQIMNSFYELESSFLDYLNRESKPKVWCVRPFCLAATESTPPKVDRKPKWVEWLDQKLAQGCSVLYVALEAILKGLEESEVKEMMTKDSYLVPAISA
ncbi:hypothetical protein L1887_10228 [Cichorium endivia]|nr:hypothetical protein L1887_10228 [Cichorium endivia]